MQTFYIFIIIIPKFILLQLNECACFLKLGFMFLCKSVFNIYHLNHSCKTLIFQLVLSLKRSAHLCRRETFTFFSQKSLINSLEFSSKAAFSESRRSRTSSIENLCSLLLFCWLRVTLTLQTFLSNWKYCGIKSFLFMLAPEASDLMCLVVFILRLVSSSHGCRRACEADLCFHWAFLSVHAGD